MEKIYIVVIGRSDGQRISERLDFFTLDEATKYAALMNKRTDLANRAIDVDHQLWLRHYDEISDFIKAYREENPEGPDDYIQKIEEWIDASKTIRDNHIKEIFAQEIVECGLDPENFTDYIYETIGGTYTVQELEISEED